MNVLNDREGMRATMHPLPKNDAAISRYFQFYLWGLFGVFTVFTVIFVVPAIPRCSSFGHLISRRKRKLPWILQKIADARKHCLYAMLDVNDYNGQSRLFTASPKQG